jgi:hypothetical protein
MGKAHFDALMRGLCFALPAIVFIGIILHVNFKTQQVPTSPQPQVTRLAGIIHHIELP